MIVLAGCGSETAGSNPDSQLPSSKCTEAEYYDHVNERCVPRMHTDPRDAGAEIDSDRRDSSVSGRETSPPSDDSGRGDRQDTLPPSCDKDEDRAIAESCGGNDCDDEDPRRAPTVPERCDEIDNDCDGEVNEGIDCSFYAHESDTLFKINPFAETATEIGADLPGLHDLDTHPDGTLYGVTPEGFYRFDQENESWTQLRQFRQDAEWVPSEPDGLAIDRRGNIFVTSRNTLYTVLPPDDEANETDNWWIEAIGTMGETDDGTPYTSSGDAVVYKKSLWMSSDHTDQQDYLVSLDQEDGTASNPLPLGYTSVFGLTTAWGELYGVTVAGELIEINPDTGESALVHEFDHRWYGAASTPNRSGDRRAK